MRRVEKDPQGGWIARDERGREIFEKGFRWNSRSVARSVVRETELFSKHKRPHRALTPEQPHDE